jgi:hypothetical protein
MRKLRNGGTVRVAARGHRDLLFFLLPWSRVGWTKSNQIKRELYYLFEGGRRSRSDR